MDNVKYVKITAPKNSHLLSVIRSLAKTGWAPRTAPPAGRLVRNGQRLILRGGKHECRLRLFVYKVTGSSRGNPDERRIEITSTYQKGLSRLPDYTDVVLGFDAEHDIYVGVDPTRIAHGGPTGNASSFFDQEGLNWAESDEILVRPRIAKLFPEGLEFHAYLKPPRLAEYMFNFGPIHAGSYSGHGLYAGVRRGKAISTLRVPPTSAVGSSLILEGPQPIFARPRASNQVVQAYEKFDARKLRRAKLTREKLLDIHRRSEEIGYIGEEFVLKSERQRLRSAGKWKLAALVRWISQESAYEGYDILSFDLSGNEIRIEVKATAGRDYVFEMSENEWKAAQRAAEKYYIYRVTEARTRPQIKIFKDPCELEAKGLLHKSPSAWRVVLQ